MNPNILGDESTIQPLPTPHVQRPAPYHFTPEELRVLRECNRESFFQRCIPLSTLMGLGAYYGVQSGYLKGNPRFGATPKVLVSVIFGYFIGKFSYQGKCAEKLMQLPNSPIGEILRRKRQGLPHDSLDSGFNPSLSPFGGISSPDVYSDVDVAKRTIDLDTPRPELEGLDDSRRPTIDTSIYDEEMPPVQQKTTTYDELRKQNREEYQQKRTGNYRAPPATSIPYRDPSVADKANFELKDTFSPKSKTNMYGDPME